MIQKIFAVVLAAFVLMTPTLHAQDEQEDIRPERKPQSEVAARDKSFLKIAATAPEVKAAKRAEDLDAAKNLVEKTASFIGTVDRIFVPPGNGLVLINFAKNFRNAVVGVVRAPDYAKFPNLNALKGKKVLITGKVTDHKGRPQVELTQLESIKLVP